MNCISESPKKWLKSVTQKLEFKSITSKDSNTSRKIILLCLFQNYPNPFNPSTIIKYTIPTPPLLKVRHEVWFVTFKVYDILGIEGAELVNEEQWPGTYEVEFSVDSSPVSRIKYPESTSINYVLVIKFSQTR